MKFQRMLDISNSQTVFGKITLYTNLIPNVKNYKYAFWFEKYTKTVHRKVDFSHLYKYLILYFSIQADLGL